MDNYIIHIGKHNKTETLSSLEQKILSLSTINTETSIFEDSYIEVLETFSNSICHKDKVVVPVEIPASFINTVTQELLETDNPFQLSNDIHLKLRTMKTTEGNYAFVAFTSHEEAMLKESSSTTTEKLDYFLQRALFDPLIDGILINPWSNSFYLPKEHIRKIFHIALPKINTNHISISTMDMTKVENNSTLEEAIQFAMNAHKGATRKGSDLPYILHPLETMEILASMNADINLMIAGVLHDTIEDTNTTLLDIYEKFGADVAALVNGHTEDKEQIWYIRKLTTIEALPQENLRQKMLTLADKLSNLRSMYKDLKQIGDKLWERFNAPKEFQSWVYSKLCDGLEELMNYPETADAYWEMTNLYKDIFVTYYINSKKELIHQISTDGEQYVLQKGNPQWCPVDNFPIIKAIEISRKEAEYIEKRWAEEI